MRLAALPCCNTFMRGLVISGLAVTDWEDGA